MEAIGICELFVIYFFPFQVRFCMHFLNGDGMLPLKTEMLTECKRESDKRLALGWPKKFGHCVAGTLHREYLTDLAVTANIEPVREVFIKMYEDSGMRRQNHPHEYRNDIYTVIDDEHFERH